MFHKEVAAPDRRAVVRRSGSSAPGRRQRPTEEGRRGGCPHGQRILEEAGKAHPPPECAERRRSMPNTTACRTTTCPAMTAGPAGAGTTFEKARQRRESVFEHPPEAYGGQKGGGQGHQDHAGKWVGDRRRHGLGVVEQTLAERNVRDNQTDRTASKRISRSCAVTGQIPVSTASRSGAVCSRPRAG